MTTPNQTRLIFVTGTDTGVGKTILTSLLLCYLRGNGSRALAMKPFCSGSRADANLLHTLQDGELSLDQINPFYFPEPVAPFVATRKHRRSIHLRDVLARIQSVAARETTEPQSRIKNQKSKINERILLIEGSGGLLVPLSEGFLVRDLIASLDCEVLVVARNRLGTINHTLLTVEAIQSAAQRTSRRPAKQLKVVLMSQRTKDFSSASNIPVLAELLAPVPLFTVPFFRRNCWSAAAVRDCAEKVKKTLSQILH